MKYNITKENPELKLSYYKVKITGLSIVPKNKVTGLSIKAKNVTISDPELSAAFIKKRINKKIEKVIDFMMRILNDEDGTDEGDAGLVLDELNRLKGIVMNKYKEHLTMEEYKSILAKLIIIEEEFKKNYNQKMYIGRMMSSPMYYEEEKIGRSR